MESSVCDRTSIGDLSVQSRLYIPIHWLKPFVIRLYIFLVSDQILVVNQLPALPGSCFCFSFSAKETYWLYAPMQPCRQVIKTFQVYFKRSSPWLHLNHLYQLVLNLMWNSLVHRCRMKTSSLVRHKWPGQTSYSWSVWYWHSGYQAFYAQ